ncbi:MAG: TatD family hydrolase [Streptococcaceae bacterium]|jgi:TatD DNase family protein|nr:TatD family hydrolase [Streptococcaceae bacterium]
MEIFDSHTHLNDTAFSGREEAELAKMQEFSVAQVNVVGCNRAMNESAVALATRTDSVFATIGWHPDDAGEFDADSERYLIETLKNPKVVAIGEIGLDYHWMVQPKWLQKMVFRRQIQLAKALDVPFQVHTRDAMEDTYALMKAEGVGARGAIIHNFSGNLKWAEKFVALGCLISFSGVVTFKKALDEQEAARILPLDKLLVETDAPYLTPVPFRGKENTPAYTRYVVEKLALLRGISAEEVAKVTTDTARKIFNI